MSSSSFVKDRVEIGSPIVLAYDNNPNIKTFNLIESLEKNNWNYKIIGIGEKWNGFMSKMFGYQNELQRMKENGEGERLCVISDARDVFCLRSPNEFASLFNDFVKGRNEEQFVVSMELFCEGKMEVSDDYSGFQCVSLKKYRDFHGMALHPLRNFVNSGLICGQVDVLLDFYKFVFENRHLHKDDDQLALGLFMNAFPEKVVADFDAELLHTCTSGVNSGLNNTHKQSMDSPSLAELNGKGAFFLHIPGLNCIKGQVNYYKIVNDLLC